MAIVLDIGQCDYDHSRIKSVLTTFGAGVERAHSLADAQSLLSVRRYDLVLINRIFDADGSEGIAAIDALLGAGVLTAPFMLISNYPEAQQEARKRGAQPGFGKDALRSPETKTLLERYLVANTGSA